MQDRIIKQFHGSIEAKMACGEALAPQLVEAAELIVARLLEEKKVLCCGNGFAHSLADIFTQCLLVRYQLERPGFPALLLGAQPGITSNLLQQSAASIFSSQVHSLGGEGDLLVCFTLGDNPGNIVKAIQSAHDRNITVIAVTAGSDTDIAASLAGNDLQLMVSNHELARTAEIQLLCLFSLCDLIDYQLFGGMP